MTRDERPQTSALRVFRVHFVPSHERQPKVQGILS